jgi:hypothetical protein
MATEWIPLLGGLAELLKTLRDIQTHNEEKRKEALVAVSMASNQTHGYIKASHQGAARSIQREHELASLWHTCSIKLKDFDSDVAQRCRLKGEYWKEPGRWTDEEINQTRIGLERVSKEAEYLLNLKIRPTKKKVLNVQE